MNASNPHGKKSLFGVIRRSPAFGVALVVVCLSVAVAMVVSSLGGGGTPTRASDTYYYDLDAGKLLTASGGQVTPLTHADGSASNIVHAYVFGCGDCGKATTASIGYLEMDNPQIVARMKARQQEGRPAPVAIMLLHLEENPQGKMVRAFNGVTGQPVGDWVIKSSEDGQRVMAELASRCGEGKPVVRCQPR